MKLTRWRWPVLGLTMLAGALVWGGCGARTGLRTPDVPSDGQASTDVPQAREICVEPRPDAGLFSINLETRPQLSVADVFLVIDRTGSMDQEIDNIKANLSSTIVPAIARTIGDVQFGVATYGDFPLDPYGDPSDVPFTLVSPIDRSVTNVQGAVNSIRVGGGGDNPEAMAEAMFQLASGEGYTPWVTPRVACAAPGRVGYGCFRPNAQAIMILVADAPSHNGPGGSNPYAASIFTRPRSCPVSLPNCAASRAPHAYAEAVTALNAMRARVIGISSGAAPFTGRGDLERFARDTGAITAAGAPLVFDIGSDGRGLDARVVTAVETFTQQVRFNAAARVIDLDPERPASRIVRGIRAVSAEPSSQVERVDSDGFYGVFPGTRLTFALDLVGDLPLTEAPQRIPARVQFLADGRPVLGYRDIVIVLPARGERCEGAEPGLDAGRQ
ncbi:MAG: VWA domain-containing protein [Myxococcales bacterium]|nr:VWA domain-containing protein [Myxococcales bacterium]